MPQISTDEIKQLNIPILSTEQEFKLIENFDLIDSMNIIRTRLDSEILNSEDFKNLVEKISINSKIKSKKDN